MHDANCLHYENRHIRANVTFASNLCSSLFIFSHHNWSDSWSVSREFTYTSLETISPKSMHRKSLTWTHGKYCYLNFINDNSAAIQSVCLSLLFLIVRATAENCMAFPRMCVCAMRRIRATTSNSTCITYRRTYLIVPQVYKSTCAVLRYDILLLAATE